MPAENATGSGGAAVGDIAAPAATVGGGHRHGPESHSDVGAIAALRVDARPRVAGRTTGCRCRGASCYYAGCHYRAANHASAGRAAVLLPGDVADRAFAGCVSAHRRAGVLCLWLAGLPGDAVLR